MRLSFKMTVAQLDVALDRPMPQSPDAERAVLGSILTNPNAFYRVIGTIETGDFFKDAHRLIFAAIRALAEKSVEIDLLTVKNELAKRAQLEQAGGSAYVSATTTDADGGNGHQASAEKSIELKAIRNRLIHAIAFSPTQNRCP